MDIKTQNVLEFNKIKSLLKSHASNAFGKRKADALTPLCVLFDVQKLMDELSEAIGLLNTSGNPDTSGVQEITSQLKRCEIGGILSAAELLAIAKVLKIARLLITYRSKAKAETLAVDGYFSRLSEHKTVESAITSAIVSEEEVDDNASPQLAQIRRQIKNTHAKIKEHLTSIIHGARFQKYLQESIITIRDGRYVVPVKAEHRSDVGGIVHDMSSTGATLFIEPNAVVEANNTLRELDVREQAEIERILAELTAQVSEIIHELFVNQEMIGEIDFLFAKARLAIAQNAVIPFLNDKGVININKGRHPLLDPKTVVPVTVRLGQDYRTLVITGPNTGGKTVTLKIIGLFSMMASAGLAVPAQDGTELCVFDDIFADIGDEQSIEQSLSTFSSHMTNIVKIIETLTPNSLVLFDELGAGTDPTEGAALAIAILKYTKDVGALSVATTHYSELKLYALTTDGVENASCEFDVNSLKPTYKLLTGVPGKSNAFAISKRLGLPDFIIDSATAHLTEESIRFEDVISSLEQSRQEAEEERTEASRYRLEIEQLKSALQAEKEKLERARQRVDENARREARRVVENAKKEADALIEEIRQAQKMQEQKQVSQAMQEVRHKLNQKLKETDAPRQAPVQRSGADAPKNLMPGSTVYLMDIEQNGTLLAAPKPDGTVTVQVGILKINSHISNLKAVSEPVKSSHTAAKSGGNGLRSLAMKNEIDLRGNTLDDALILAEKYIDDAYLSNMNTLSVIHGKGTGVLRKGIHDMLKKHPHVKRYRLGTFGEGESGVTIVELK